MLSTALQFADVACLDVTQPGLQSNFDQDLLGHLQQNHLRVMMFIDRICGIIR
jgi:hypothetical protein